MLGLPAAQVKQVLRRQGASYQVFKGRDVHGNEAIHEALDGLEPTLPGVSGMLGVLMERLGGDGNILTVTRYQEVSDE